MRNIKGLRYGVGKQLKVELEFCKGRNGNAFVIRGGFPNRDKCITTTGSVFAPVCNAPTFTLKDCFTRFSKITVFTVPPAKRYI